MSASPLLAPFPRIALKSLGDRLKTIPAAYLYDKLLREDGSSSPGKSRKSVLVGTRVCYGKLLRDLPRGVLRRGQKLYYRHFVPVDAQRLLNRLEIWRSPRTDSLAVAVRRLPSVVARIELEIEHVRAMTGLPVDATLFHPLQDDLLQRPVEVVRSPPTSVQRNDPLTLGDAYRSYIDERPTRRSADVAQRR